jgi:hypothetical protein
LRHSAVISYGLLHLCYITDEMSQKDIILVMAVVMYLCSFIRRTYSSV